MCQFAIRHVRALPRSVRLGKASNMCAPALRQHVTMSAHMANLLWQTSTYGKPTLANWHMENWHMAKQHRIKMPDFSVSKILTSIWQPCLKLSK